MKKQATSSHPPLSPSAVPHRSQPRSKEKMKEEEDAIAVQDQSSDEQSLASPARQRSLHQILGGGLVADVILWRRKNVTLGILTGALATWLIFEVAGYTLLSLVSNVLLLLISILFLWAKAAGILNRPPPPIPEMHVSEEMIDKASEFVCFHVNILLSAFNDVAQGKNSKLYYTIAFCLVLMSTFGRLTDILTFSYASLVIILTVPALYEKYEACIDRCVNLVHKEVHMYKKVYTEMFSKYVMKVQKWILSKKQLLAEV